MSLDLTAPLDQLAAQLASGAPARAGAAAAAEVMQEATARVLGGDLAMSGLKGGDTAEFDTSHTEATAVVVAGVGPVFALADTGRKRRVPAHAARRSALATPWGPRVSVEGSVWEGFGITSSAGPEALRAAGTALVESLEWGS